jgi:glucose-6-phosphate isomerase
VESVHEVLERVESFTEKVRSAEHRGAGGDQIKNFVAIGIGGSQLGPEFVNEVS